MGWNKNSPKLVDFPYQLFTLPETNSEFSPENWMIGRRSFRCKLAVSFREGRHVTQMVVSHIFLKLFNPKTLVKRSNLTCAYFSNGLEKNQKNKLPPDLFHFSCLKKLEKIQVFNIKISQHREGGAIIINMAAEGTVSPKVGAWNSLVGVPRFEGTVLHP